MNTNKNEISLYNIATIFREYYYHYALISNNANEELASMYNEDCVVIMDYNHDTKELSVIDPHAVGTVMGDYILFYKDQNNKLKNRPSINGTFLSFIYANLEEYLIDIIDKYAKFDNFYKYELNEQVNNYKIYINYFNIEVINDKLKIVYNYLYDKYQVIDKNSKKEVKIIRNNLDEVFKNIFINISLLPKFMQSEFNKMRNEELDKGITRKRIYLKEFFE